MAVSHFLKNKLLLLEGRLYSGNLTEVSFRIESALDRTKSLIVDLDPLEKIDAAGAFMLYITTEKARENNKEIILFCKKNKTVKSVLSLVGIPYASKLPQTIL